LAKWKKLTGLDDRPVYVNIEVVASISVTARGTVLNIAGGRSEAGTQVVTVKEKPDVILSTPSIPSN
jgi:hypothetical protein